MVRLVVIIACRFVNKNMCKFVCRREEVVEDWDGGNHSHCRATLQKARTAARAPTKTVLDYFYSRGTSAILVGAATRMSLASDAVLFVPIRVITVIA